MFARLNRKPPPAMTLEGVLGPNGRLDRADAIAVDAPGALACAEDGRLLVSSGCRVLTLARWGETPAPWAELPAPVTALAVSPGGRVAIGLAGGGLSVRDAAGRSLLGWAPPVDLVSIVDCLFLSEEEIALVDCGYGAGQDVLSRAPWEEAARGRVVALTRDGGATTLRADLHCPMGLCRDAEGGLVVSELERARLLGLDGVVRRAGFPGYLGRVRPMGTGYLLACLARRDPLIEFLKTETAFIAEMKATIDPHYWISPRANPEFSHDFPIELGATRLFGEVKPWAPSFSYGLVIELDAAMMPVASAHSRANGYRHAVTDAIPWNGDLIAVSTGSAELLNLGPEKVGP
ncbi:hypothetical protein KAJ83_04290 [Marivibrio halodurans]|uniref:Strictosidine synthase n=1 Tax=Marivibrio halodurans TaxID=2039722 RepID=A0A8J7UZZ8_9PROT|nr:hypothetical protein [Marivibrio halodurans]MBP5856216.1 hypothetical protein [Marivibrio halodurans]